MVFRVSFIQFFKNGLSDNEVVKAADARPFQLTGRKEKINFNEPDAKKTIRQISDLTSQGYVGVSYDRKSHKMLFVKLKIV